MLKARSHPDQLNLDLSKDAAIERMIEARVAVRAESDAIRWRFRLILIETVMIASLVAIAGFVLDQPTLMVARSALLVGAACFASGVILIGLSGVTGHLLSLYRRWRQP